MNPLHYPDIERCKKLTELGFRCTTTFYLYGDGVIADTTYSDIPGKGLGTPCPSVMELLDVIAPRFVDIQMQGPDNLYLVSYLAQASKKILHFQDTLPNALCDLIFWLVDNKYLTFNK